MDLGPKEIGIIAALLLGALALGARQVWSFKWQNDQLVGELKASHERERVQWDAQMQELRKNCQKAEEREKVLFDIAFARRELLAQVVDVAVANKG